MRLSRALKEETVTPLTDGCVKDHDNSSGVFRGYAHNKSSLQAKHKFVPLYAYNASK